MAGGIRSLDSFMESYSEPAWLDEKPQSFASALKEWQQIQGNYYKNDKAKMELEDKEESREKKKEREKKMLELGLTLDPDDLRGSLRKVIDFSNGEGDINTSLNIMGRLYQMDKADKREREAAARKASGITNKEQAKLEKIAKDEKTNSFLRAGIAEGGFTPEGIQNAAVLAIQNGDLESARSIGTFGKTFFGSGKNSSANDDLLISALTNNTNKNQTPQQPINTAGHKVGDRRTNKNTGEVQIFNAKGEWETVGKVK